MLTILSFSLDNLCDCPRGSEVTVTRTTAGLEIRSQPGSAPSEDSESHGGTRDLSGSGFTRSLSIVENVPLCTALRRHDSALAD